MQKTVLFLACHRPINNVYRMPSLPTHSINSNHSAAIWSVFVWNSIPVWWKVWRAAKTTIISGQAYTRITPPWTSAAKPAVAYAPVMHGLFRYSISCGQIGTAQLNLPTGKLANHFRQPTLLRKVFGFLSSPPKPLISFFLCLCTLAKSQIYDKVKDRAILWPIGWMAWKISLFSMSIYCILIEWNLPVSWVILGGSFPWRLLQRLQCHQKSHNYAESSHQHLRKWSANTSNGKYQRSWSALISVEFRDAQRRTPDGSHRVTEQLGRSCRTFLWN